MHSPIDIATTFIRERSWSPIPVPFKSKNPGFDNWEKLIIDESDVAHHFNGNPQNIGVLLGEPSDNVVDIDLDCPEAIALAPQFLPATDCRFGRKSKRASHWLYKSVGAKTAKFQDRCGDDAMIVELRSTGGQTVMPGSVHPSGEPIQWEPGGDGRPAEVGSDDLLKCVRRLAAASLLTRYWPGKGTLNTMSLNMAGALLRSGFAAGEASDFIFRCARVAGSPDPEKDAGAVQYTADKIAAGENVTGWPSVAECLRGDGEKIVKTVRKWLGCAGNDGADPALPSGVAPYADLANAYRVQYKHGADLRFTSSLGWLVFDGGRFEPDATGAAARKVHDITMDLLNDAGIALLTASKEPDPQKREKALARAGALEAWAKKSQQRPRIEAALSIAQTLQNIACNTDVFDREPWILNCRNGTLELRTGRLKAHDRADSLTKIVPVDYDPNVVAPTWLEFLTRIFDEDEELIAFVQRAVGYSLTGSTAEQCFFVCHGTGANGKSTLLEALRYVLGDYAMNTSTDTFLRTKDKRGAENDIARLRGARFVSAVESGEGRKLDEERIKRLTGTDTVTARFLYREHFEFQPVCKIWLAVNDRPEITGVDHGIWRRVRLIPFNVTIPEAEQDGDLPARLRSEAAGILRWAVDGCFAWQEQKLNPPEVVQAATTSWKADTNIVAAFVDERCVKSERMSMKASHLYGAYVEWAKGLGEEPMTAKKFGMRLGAQGFKPDRDRYGSRLWMGIVLRADNADEHAAKERSDA